MSETREPGAAPDDLLAAEHALGVLSAPERRVAERRVRDDPAFAAAVEAWNERLGPMLSAVEPVEPSQGLWAGVEASLPRQAASAVPVLRGVSPWWRSAALGAGGLLAASIAALFLLVPTTAPPSATLAARISGGDGLPLFTAVLDPASGQATLVPLSVSVEAGRVPELWFVPTGGAPVSLGVVRGDEPLRIDLHGRALGDMVGTGGALAVSVEPTGGSPTGAPTGPVIGQGALSAI